MLGAPAICGAGFEPGTRLRYTVLSAKTEAAPPFEAVDFVYGPRDDSAGSGGVWWQIEIRARAALTNEPLCILRALTSSDPLGSKAGGETYSRYQLQIPETGEKLEYVESHSGLALLPPWVDFNRWFVPHSAAGSKRRAGIPETCEFLGQVLTLQSISTNKWQEWHDVKRLIFDREVLIGNSRDFKDTEGRRLPQTPVKQEYTYVQFNEADYGEMISAGMNLFTVAPEQKQWVQDEAVFYVCENPRGNPPVRFPADLYRANFLGTGMFMDEPASVVVWDPPVTGRMVHFCDVTALIEQRTRSMYNSDDPYYGIHGLEKLLGENLGEMRLAQSELPVWETQYDRTFYLMKGGGTGIIHEGRYQLAEFNGKVARIAGTNCRFAVRGMLEYYYAWLRGGVRPFGKSWGTAIYGQCDPAIAPEAFTLAYDMGARYFWFWSSDHGHHVPWVEQLALTRRFKSYMESHPRASICSPAPKLDAVIAIPEGMFVSLDDPIWLRGFDRASGNEESREYRSLQREVLQAVQKCEERGWNFDITVDDGRRINGYRHVFRLKG